MEAFKTLVSDLKVLCVQLEGGKYGTGEEVDTDTFYDDFASALETYESVAGVVNDEDDEDDDEDEEGDQREGNE